MPGGLHPVFIKNLLPRGWMQFEVCLLWYGPHARTGEGLLSEQWQKLHVMNGHGPHSPSACATAGKEVEPRKKGEVGQEMVLRLLLYFSLSCSDFVANKYN